MLRRILVRIAITVVLVLPTYAAEASAALASDLRFVLILTRHGIRSPLDSQRAALDRYAAEPWPAWSVPPGYLTEHGKAQMALMGEYYRQRFVREGLLTGVAAEDAARIYFRSDSDQRTIETARGLGQALVPGIAIDPHAREKEGLDPLFRPAQLPIGPLDRELAVASVLGRVGGDPSRVVEANRAAFDTLEKILVGESEVVPAGKTALLSLPSHVRPGKLDHTVTVDGPLQVAESITDLLVLEYGEGMPPAQVGWGRATPERITQVLALHSLFFELTQGSSYSARAQASDLTAHIVATLNQAATHQRSAAAFGRPEQKLVVVVGHDTNLSNVAGLLGLTWWMPGTHRNPVLPGGALVFELRERRADHRLVVRVSYVAQTLEQMRNLTPLSLEQPPVTAPIFDPGASGASDGFAAPLERFMAVANASIDPAFVVADPN